MSAEKKAEAAERLQRLRAVRLQLAIVLGAATIAAARRMSKQWADAGPPPGSKRPGGLVVAASGLAATLMTAASALSTTGTVATVAASAAGLFSFKLSKVWPTHRRADGAPPRIAMLSAPRPVVLL